MKLRVNSGGGNLSGHTQCMLAFVDMRPHTNKNAVLKIYAICPALC